MKVLNVFWILLFLFSTAVQYNDPDPYVWMPIYLYGAVLCVLALRRKFSPILYLIGFAVYLPYMAYKFFDQDGVIDWMMHHHSENIVETMEATKPWIEETREAFGLLLLIIALSGNWLWLGRKGKNGLVS